MAETIEVAIFGKDQTTFISWVEMPMRGMRLVMSKILGATEEQIDAYEKELENASVNSFSTADGEFTMITSNQR